MAKNGNTDSLKPVPTAPGGGTGPPPPGPILASDMTLRDWFAGQVLAARRRLNQPKNWKYIATT